MSSDTLVIKVTEYGATTEKEISPIGIKNCGYVFYDYKTELFGIRCGYYKKNGGKVTYSYFVDSKDVMIDFLLEFIGDPKRAIVRLINYSDFPTNFDDITYEFLKKNDKDENEISGYTCKNYNEDNEDEVEDEDEDDDELYPIKELRRFANIIESVYNEY